MNQMLQIIDMNSVLMSECGPFVGAPTDVIYECEHAKLVMLSSYTIRYTMFIPMDLLKHLQFTQCRPFTPI